MILGSQVNDYGNQEYMLVMDEADYKDAKDGKTLYRLSYCREIAGEWQVKFKKFSKAKSKRMGL